jgi:hypothetical protein
MGQKRKEAPMKANAITLTPNGRLTEHIAHVDVRGDRVPTLTYRNGSGRKVSFTPMKLILTFQWSWSIGGWHLLEIKVLGRNGSQDVEVRFRNPDQAPEWVREAVEMASPTLETPQEMNG